MAKLDSSHHTALHLERARVTCITSLSPYRPLFLRVQSPFESSAGRADTPTPLPCFDQVPQARKCNHCPPLPPYQFCHKPHSVNSLVPVGVLCFACRLSARVSQETESYYGHKPHSILCTRHPPTICHPRAREAPTEPSLVNNQADQTTYSNVTFTSISNPPANAQEADRASPVSAAPPLPHGYNQAPATQNESHIHPQLRSSHDSTASSGYAPVPSMMPAGLSPTSDQSGSMSGPTATLVVPAGGLSDGGEGGADGRKAKRELSQSKRAAQNRAAQRAFRQRKEGYIKKLEQQVRDYVEMENSYKVLQTENYSLREYVIHLQSRLLDAQGEYPQPPPNINLAHPHAPPTVATAPEPTQPASVTPAPNSLEVAAQAVAGLSRSEHLAGRDAFPNKYEPGARTDDDARTAEEITRQLQADGSAESLPTAAM
ncbi:hypothetical protein B0H66DRAFT_532935 [Apodospora peruviana]|uniref:Putative transcription factor kapC n=1 Tax=Apodospora peruviana TaxID=516989 RepID=A0AAE0I4V5_9PEZI|nr:hypothetical protein B0H66DRAFT_532935 [Apodospora peruviana]